NKIELFNDQDSLDQTDLTTRRIDTTEAKPIRQHFYRIFSDEQEFIDKELVNIEKQRLIQKSESP
ncbi:4016_t:CDS:1, partial [Scutellospora calospora]